MRFELTVALKYLIPRWRQLSVSIISLISILVISLVVWLVVVFLSVTEGIEKKWVEELVSLNAPVRLTPTEEYYRSYYFQIDGVSFNSNYMTKSIGEKLLASQSDPYDPMMDAELPPNFPPPERRTDGTIKDPVKESWNLISALPSVRPQEYEVSFGNLRLGLLREEENSLSKTYITQISYLASHDDKNTRFQELIIPPNEADLNNLLFSLTQSIQWDDEEEPRFNIEEPGQLRKNLTSFFNSVDISEVEVEKKLLLLPKSLYPQNGALQALGVVSNGEIQRVYIPQESSKKENLSQQLTLSGYETTDVELLFKEGIPEIHSSLPVRNFPLLILGQGTTFRSQIDSFSIEKASNLAQVQLELDGKIQSIPVQGKASIDSFRIKKAHIKNATDPHSFWIHNDCDRDGTSHCVIPKETGLGDGLLLSKHFMGNGVKIGDRGTLSYYTPTTSSMQEQRIPVYVAGFYDPGLMPIGSKLIFTDPQIVSQFRGNFTVQDQMLGNGINLWLTDLKEAEEVKRKVQEILHSNDLSKYWKVESFHDYEFARPVLQQLESDKTLFTLIAIIILIVACSNIISMLILLVNDKKREIGIMQSMGASSGKIAMIFGVCGFTTGLISSILGTIAAIFTLARLQSLVDFLSFLQGHEAFQAAFYGSKLPNELSYHALGFVLVATLIISVLAGMIPAIKAARIRPSEILRTE